MSNTSIFGKRWLDLVFEGRNKAYGAYQLRLENRRTMMLALVYALLSISGISGGVFLLSSFGNKPEMNNDLPPVFDDSIHPVKIVFPHDPKPFVPPAKKAAPPVNTKPADDWRINPQVAQRAETTVDPDNTPIEPPVSPSTAGDTSGDASQTGSSAAGTESSSVDLGNEAVIASAVDKQPLFPGGINKFYERVANDFEKSAAEDEATVRIIVSFVVEKDGSMSNFKVLNQPGESLSFEAVRVLKTIGKKKKWEPGVKNGQPVRTIFTLPIVFKPQ